MRNEFEHYQREINDLREKLTNHQVYEKLTSLENLRVFCEVHCFAVWDFMSLLKGMQNKLTCTTIPWSPKDNKEVVRLVNEIVLCEESDMDFNGDPMDHFSMYLKGMKEINASTSKIDSFIKTVDLNLLPADIRKFTAFTLDIALNGEVYEMAGAFLFGRESIIPSMFSQIEKTIDNNSLEAQYLRYYFKRHIEIDGDEHADMAEKLLDIVCENDPVKYERAYKVGIDSLRLRNELWDQVIISMEHNQDFLFR